MNEFVATNRLHQFSPPLDVISANKESLQLCTHTNSPHDNTLMGKSKPSSDSPRPVDGNRRGHKDVAWASSSFSSSSSFSPFVILKHCVTKVACHWECTLHVTGLQVLSYFYPFRNIYFYVSGATVINLCWLLAFAFCASFRSSELLSLLVAVTLEYLWSKGLL